MALTSSRTCCRHRRALNDDDDDDELPVGDDTDSRMADHMLPTLPTSSHDNICDSHRIIN